MKRLALLALLALTQATDGVIEVAVRDLNTREELPAVRVTVSLVPTQPTQPPSFVSTSFTDSKGLATFRNLGHGVYQVKAEREGYAPNPITGNRNSQAFVHEGSLQLKVSLELGRVFTMTGRVLKEDGTPLKKARVSPLQLRYRNGRRELTRVSGILVGVEAYTNERGEYRLEGLPFGEYYVRVDNRGLLSDTNQSEARVTFYPGVSRTADAISVRPRGQDVSGVDIKVPNPPLFRIGGILAGIPDYRRPDGASPANNSFFLIPADPQNIDEVEPLHASNILTEVPGESRFELRGVLPGSYNLVAFNSLGESRLVSQFPISIVDRDVDGLRMVLARPPELKGRFIIDGDASAIQGRTLGVALSPASPLPILLATPAGLQAQTTNRDFTLTGLLEDVRYNPTVFGLPTDAYVADIRQDGVSVYNTGAAIRSNPSDGPIEIQVAPRGGTVEGVARESSGQVAAQAAVVLVPASPRRGHLFLYKDVQTDGSGRFAFRGVAPGDYKVFAWPRLPAGQAYLNEDFLGGYEPRATSVKANAGATSSVQVMVVPLQ